jgi:O-antigen ligase
MADETSGLPRARSIFGEPQNLGWFVFVSLPIYFKVCFGQYRIYKNKFWNIVIKKSLIPLAYVNAFLCMSPIALLAITILTLSFLGKSILKYIKKYMISILTTIVLVLGSISLIFIFAQDAFMNFVESSFLARALNVIHSMKDFETLVEVEPSLASRITSFTNSFILFLKHPLMGLGYDNARFYMYDQFLHSPLPLTKENYGRMLVDVVTGSGTWFSKATLFTLLVDTGIIGTGLFYTFLIKSVIVANKIKNKFTGLEFKFIDGLRVSYIAMISVSFYLYMLFDTVQCFCFGLLCSFVYAAKNRKLTSNEEENLHE